VVPGLLHWRCYRALVAVGLVTFYVCNRNPDRLAGFITFAQNNYPSIHCEAVSWEQDAVTPACADATLLINTTTIGLTDDQGFPFSLSGSGAAIDAVCKPDGDTAFCRAAAVSRSAVVDGLPMLIAQGAESFAWWHGCERPDCSVSLRNIESSLARVKTNLPAWSRTLCVVPV